MTAPPKSSPNQIAAIARETIRTLAARQLPATPANYQLIYRQIAGAEGARLTASEAMVRLARAQPDATLGAKLAAAAQEDQWSDVERLLTPLVSGEGAATPANVGPEVAALVGRLVGQLDTHHSGITLSKKREGLKRALVPRSESYHEFQARLVRLIDSWSGAAADAAAATTTDALGPAFGTATETSSAARDEMPAALTASNIFDSVAQTVEERRSKRVPLDTSGPLVARLRLLLKMVLDNIAELTPEAEMLPMQIEQIERILADPLTEHKLEEAERVLRNLIIRQGTIKHGIEEAKTAAKELASGLIERLTSLSTSTGAYTGKVLDMSSRIARAENLTQLSHLVMALLSDSQIISGDLLRARDDLDAARAHARSLETRTKALEAELAQASALVRTDPLTTTLNRRGFEEVYAAQAAQASGKPLCVALLDVDDFKKVNDSFGHVAGDDALRFLTDVMRDITRPTDSIGRYGGEEFVVLFPHTSLTDAEEVMVRIQRELTRRVFMQDHSRLLLTFSCGLTRIEPGEGLEKALLRADQALLEAKRKGKNKVFTI